MTTELFKGCANNQETCSGTLYEALSIAWSPRKLHTQLSGHGGSGVFLDAIPQILPSLLMGLVLYFIRESLRGPLIYLGRRLGVKGKKTIMKFQNQCWLALFYTCSTVYGYMVLRDEPFFKFPLFVREGDGAASSMWNHHPMAPKWWTVLYYNYEIGFYLTELTTLFVYGKRSDFAEMTAHHIFTLSLLTFSHLGYYHRLGSYILLIHDASDIPLCVAKMIVYCGAPQWLSETGLVAFAAAFVFFRLYVFPITIVVNWGVAPKLIPFTYNLWFLLYVLHVLLQSLHIYWFALILKVAFRSFWPSFKGDRRAKDVRSSDEAEDEGLSGSDDSGSAHKSKKASKKQ